jgi:hypothetical protein
MSEARPFCFVIMPFRAELHYFYLYLKAHIEHTHHLDCERGDGQVLTTPILEKINDYIRRADVIIADCSGRNANVFYELGIAHAYDKKVILITSDDVTEAPSDIRHFEFIRYDLGRHIEFLERLDNALRNVFVYRYERLYERAQEIFREFRRETGAPVGMATKDVFIRRVAGAEDTRGLPQTNDEIGITELVLPRIIADSSDIAVMTTVTTWLSTRFGVSENLPLPQS